MQFQCPKYGGGAAQMLTVFLWVMLLVGPGTLLRGMLLAAPDSEYEQYKQFPLGFILGVLLALGLSIVLVRRLRPRNQRLGLGVVLFLTSIVATAVGLPVLSLLLTIFSESFGGPST